MAASAPAPDQPLSAAAIATVEGSPLKKIVVVNFDDDGIVYCVDDNNNVYDTEDVFYDVRPARLIGRRVDGKFVPNPKITTSASAIPTAREATASCDVASATASS